MGEYLKYYFYDITFQKYHRLLSILKNTIFVNVYKNLNL